MGNPLKKISKGVSGIAKGASKAIKPFATAGTDAVKAIGRGDVMGLADAAVRSVTYGSMSLNSNKGFVDVANTMGEMTGANAMRDALEDAANQQAANEKAAAAAQAKQESEAKAAAISRRRADLDGESKTVYTTALGDVANSARDKTRKRTVLGG